MSDWESDLDEFFDRKEQLEQAELERKDIERQEVESFLSEIVVPAFERIKEFLGQYGREVEISSVNEQATLSASYEGEPEIVYRIRANMPQPTVRYAYVSKATGEAMKASDVLTTAEGEVPAGKITQEVIIKHFIRKYKSVA